MELFNIPNVDSEQIAEADLEERLTGSSALSQAATEIGIKTDTG